MGSSLHEQFDLAIFQLVVYVLIAPFALYVFANTCIKKKAWYAAGWFYLLGFLGILVAASGIIVGAGRNNFDSTGLILQSVGLSPLFIVVDSVIREAVVKTRKSGTFLFSLYGVIALHVVIATAAVLVGIGASKYFTSSKLSEVQDGLKLAKAGAIVFIGPWLWLVTMAVVACAEWMDTNKKLLIAGIVSILLLVLRIIYGILEFFDTSSTTFSPFNGNIVARILMQILPLMFAAGILTVAGVWAAIASSANQEGSWREEKLSQNYKAEMRAVSV